MSVEDSDGLEVRCFCRRAPLLAICGRNKDNGEPFVHVKSARKDRINAEAIIVSGEVRIRCRDCLRWHTIRIKTIGVDHTPEQLPESIDIS